MRRWNDRGVLCAGEQSPRSLQLQVRLQVGGGRFELRGDGNVRAVQAAMEGLRLTADKFPETLVAAASLAGVALTAPEGVIVRAGARLCGADSAADPGKALFCLTSMPAPVTILFCRRVCAKGEGAIGRRVVLELKLDLNL